MFDFSLRNAGRFSRYRAKRRSHVIDDLCPDAEPLSLDDPAWFVIRKPCLARRILPKTSAFNGRSIPAVWDACMSGVPPRALPKMMRFVGPSVSPASAAPAEWSICAKIVRPFERISARSRSIVSFGSKLLGMVVRPSTMRNESDAGINQPGKKIAVDDEAAPFCVVVSGRFGGNGFFAGPSFLF